MFLVIVMLLAFCKSDFQLTLTGNAQSVLIFINPSIDFFIRHTPIITLFNKTNFMHYNMAEFIEIIHYLNNITSHFFYSTA